MSRLTSEQRDALPASAFVFPDTREYPIADESHADDALARSAGKPEHAKVVAAVRRKFPNIDVSKAEMSVDLTVPLFKDDAKQLVYGVVLTPGLKDSQGDIASEHEIEQAAHRFLTDYRQHDVQHAEQTAGVRTVESFVAPQDLEIAGQPVRKGSWVMATHVADPAVWQQVQKGEITGYSIGGSAIRLPETD